MADNYVDRSDLTAINEKLDKLISDSHKHEIHLAKLTAAQDGKTENMEYRLDQLESKYISVVRAVVSLVVGFLLTVIGAVVNHFSAGAPVK